MVGQISMTPDQMRMRASEFKQEGDNFQECITKMRSLIDALQEEWKGQASQSFATQFTELEPHFNNVRELIDDIGRQLESTAAAVENLDQEIASRINS